jgi:hypothetical protein
MRTRLRKRCACDVENDAHATLNTPLHGRHGRVARVSVVTNKLDWHESDNDRRDYANEHVSSASVKAVFRDQLCKVRPVLSSFRSAVFKLTKDPPRMIRNASLLPLRIETRHRILEHRLWCCISVGNSLVA